MKKIDYIVFLLCSLSLASNAYSQAPGESDTTFGNNGVKLFNTNNETNDLAYSVTALQDGKILVSGNSEGFSVIRYNPDGSLDQSFGNDGSLVFSFGISDSGALDAVMQADGKIALTGRTTAPSSEQQLTLVRLEVNGDLDSSFGDNGVTSINLSGERDRGHAIHILDNGNFLVAGSSSGPAFSDIMLVKFTMNGSLDTSFGNNGFVVTQLPSDNSSPHKVVVLENGKIVVGGYKYTGSDTDFLVLRYLPTGELDTSFGINGIATTNFPSTVRATGWDMEIKSDGKILQVGRITENSQTNPLIVRWNEDGTLDTTFGNDGFVIDSILARSYSLLVQPDGKFLVGGKMGNDMLIIRYLEDGIRDSGFGNEGVILKSVSESDSQIEDMAFQPDGNKLITTGSTFTPLDTFSFVTARYFLGALNIDEFNIQNSGIVYPNPVEREVVLNYVLRNETKLNIGIYDISGRLIQKILDDELIGTGEHKMVIDLKPLTAGTYFIRLGDFRSIKLIKE